MQIEVGEIHEIGSWKGKSLKWHFLDAMRNGKLLFLCHKCLLQTTFDNLDNVVMHIGKDLTKSVGTQIGLMPIEAAAHYKEEKFMKVYDNNIGLDWWVLPKGSTCIADVLTENYSAYYSSEQGDIVQADKRCATEIKWFRPVIVVNSDWFENKIGRGGNSYAKESGLC